MNASEEAPPKAPWPQSKYFKNKEMEKKSHRLLTPFILFILTALTLVVYSPVARGMGRFVNGSLDDAYAIIWQLWWFKFSLLDLVKNPFFSDFIEAPYGVHLTFTTLFNYVIALPVTWAAGPVASYNFMILLSFVLSGLGMYLLSRRLTGAFIPSAFAALLYAFSPYHTVFSGSGGMDAAQIQYLPFTLLFLLKYEESRSISDLAFLAFFFGASVFSFGYYAVLASLTIAVFFAYFRVSPSAKSVLHSTPSGWDLSGRRQGRKALQTILLASIAYLFTALTLNSLDEAPFYLKAVLLLSMLYAVYASSANPDGAVKRIFTGLRSIASRMDKRHRTLGVLGAAAGTVMAAAILLPVFSRSSRNISLSYIVPYYSYLVPPPSHPLLGGLIPSLLTPEPDPLSGRFVYTGAAFLFLSIYAAMSRLRKPGAQRDETGFLTVLFMAALSLTLPPSIEVGSLSVHGPVYYLHELVPPFVDIRRVVLLVLLPGCALAAAGLKEAGEWAGGRHGKIAVYSAAFLIAAVEYYPPMDIKDVYGSASAYSWLSGETSPGNVAQYPLTSIYDSRRYEPFFGQTIHLKKVAGTFGSVGHDPRPENPGLRKLLDRGGALGELLTNPSNASAALSAAFVRYLVVRTERLNQSPSLDAAEGLIKKASFADSEVYEITEPPGSPYLTFSDFHRTGVFLNYLKRENGSYRLENPFFIPPEFIKAGLPWLWMGKKASIKIENAGAGTSAFTLRFRAVSNSPVRLKVSSGEYLLKEFDVSANPSELSIEGLKPVSSSTPLILTLEVKGDSSPVYYFMKETLAEKTRDEKDRGGSGGGAVNADAAGEKPRNSTPLYLGVGIRDAVVTPHNDAPERAVTKSDGYEAPPKRLNAKRQDGLFAGMEPI